MPNGLTGDYDAVLEVTNETIGRVLATIHQNGATPDASPTFLHSVAARIGDDTIPVHFELAENFLRKNFGSEIADTTTLPRDVLRAIQERLLDTQKGASKIAQDIARLMASDSAWNVASILGSLIDIAVVRGTAQVQLGTLALSVPAGSTTEVVVHAPVRAHYFPDPGTAALPAPIHGEAQAAFSVSYNPSGKNGKPTLEVKATTDKNKIAFSPASGTLTASQAGQITREIQRFVITNFATMSVEVPTDFMFGQFKGLVAGGVSAIALPLKLSGPRLPASALGSVTNLFLASDDDFAVAVSEDYINGTLLGDMLRQIKTAIPSQSFDAIFFGGEVSLSDAWVECNPGHLTVVVAGHLHEWVWNPFGDDAYYDWDFKIMQDLALSVTAAGDLSLYIPAGADLYFSGLPTFSGSAQDWFEQAKQLIRSVRDTALAQAQNQIKSALKDATHLEEGLKAFDAGLTVNFKTIEITADGVIVRGKVTMSARPNPFVDIVQTPDGGALTVLKSWIPGGTINRFVWSWVVRSSPLPWVGTVKELPQQHDFIFRWGSKPNQKPWEVTPPPWQTYGVCLSVEGIQVGTSSASIKDVSATASSAGQSCGFAWPEWLAVPPAWWADLLAVPVWGPDPGPASVLGPESALKRGITAHINVRPALAPPTAARTSVLVHFADGKHAPLPLLGEAMHRSKHRESGIPIIVVLPTGSFGQRRPVVEASLGSFREDLALPLVVTENYEGGWTQAFGATGGAATYLLSPDGELAWRHQGHFDPTSLAAALDQHAVAAQRRRSRLIRTAIRVGQPIPDSLYDAARHEGDRSRSLRRRRLLLLFWKSWSTPCINELLLLQQMHRRTGGRELTIVGIADGEDPKRTDEVVRRHHLGFLIVPDPDRRIARRCGIECWPTFVWVREDGLVNAIHFGATHPPRHPAGAVAVP